jgi:hypothetical protein
MADYRSQKWRGGFEMASSRLLKSRRFWTWIVLGVLAISIMGPVIWIVIPKPGINRQNYLKIQIGMTVDEVTALMGHPPGNYARPTSSISATEGESTGEITHEQLFWFGDSGFVVVNFDDNNCVRGAGFCPVQDTRDNSGFGRLFGPIRRLFGL